MSYCMKCGAPRVAGSSFCTACGAPQAPVAAMAQPIAPPPQPVTVPNGNVTPYVSPAARKRGSGLRNFLIIAALCLLIVIGLGVAGAIYAVHFAKEKAQGLLKQIVPSSTASAGSPSPGRGPSAANAPLPPPSASSFPPWPSTSSPAPIGGGPAPLKVGMLVVTAVADEQGDYESMKQIVSIDASGTTLSYHSDKPKAGDRIIRISGRDYGEPDRAAAGP